MFNKKNMKSHLMTILKELAGIRSRDTRRFPCFRTRFLLPCGLQMSLCRHAVLRNVLLNDTHVKKILKLSYLVYRSQLEKKSTRHAKR